MHPNANIAMKRTIYLHIGTYKTGTSSLQDFFSKNSAVLLSKGILYPLTGRRTLDGEPSPRHMELSWMLGKKPHLMDALRLEIERTDAPSVLLSSETFSSYAGMPSLIGNLSILKKAFSDYNVKVIVFLRSQTSFIPSFYNLKVKIGREYRTLHEFCRQDILDNPNFYNYHGMLLPWKATFSTENINVHVYHMSLNRNNRLFSVFLDAIGTSLTSDFLMDSKPKNVSLPQNALDVLCSINRTTDLSHKEEFIDVLSNLSDSDALVNSYSDAKPGLNCADIEYIREYFSESNKIVAYTYLGREDGVLFAEQPPRNSQQTDSYDPETTKENLAILVTYLWDQLQQNTQVLHQTTHRFKRQLRDTLAAMNKLIKT